MSIEISGKIIVLNDTETVGANNFEKRLVVLETLEQYKQTIPIEFLQDKVDLLDPYKIDDEVKIHVNLRGSEGTNGRWFLNCNGWRVERLEEPTVASGAKQESAKQKDVFADDGDDSSENLPF